MNLRSAVIGSVVGLFVLLGVRESRAADQEALLKQMTDYNKNAVTAYSNGDFDKAKGQLLRAVALAKKDSELAAHPLMARTYIHLGVLYVDGFEDRKTGVKYFVKALKIRPDITVSDALATKTVKSAFEEASGESGGGGGTETAQAEATETNAGGDETAGEPKLSAKAMAAEKKRAEAEAREAEKQAREEEKASKLRDKQDAKAIAAEKKRADAEAREADRQAREEKEKLLKELAQTGGSEAKERAAKEKLLKEKAQRDELLAEAKDMLKQLQKEKQENEKQQLKEKQDLEKQTQKEKQDLEKQAAADKASLTKEMQAAEKQAQKEKQDLEKQAAAEKDKLQKELAQVRDSEAKERAAKEKLQVEKQEKDRLLAEAKSAIQQLQKDKSDREKQLADTGGREKREREAKEKLEREKQLAEQQEKERKAQAEAERQERERLAAGPDMPSHFSESVYCAMPDVAQAGSDLFVHCATKPNVKANVIAFYYRASGGMLYNSVTLEPSKKGWHATVIPADKITGKVLQYYAEARDGHGAVAAANGKANSPNILTLKPATSGNRPRGKSR